VLFRSGDTLAGVHNLNGEFTAAILHLELTADHILLAHQDDFDSQVPGGANRPFDFSFGGVVTAHCVHRNGQHVVPGLLLFDFDNFAAFVLPTVGADAVGQLGFVAVGALGQAGGFERIVRAAGAGPLLGVSTFGIRHISFSTNLSSAGAPRCIFKNVSDLKFAERFQAMVVAFDAAIAFNIVPVLATDRANSFAVFAAHSLHRQGQQDLFAEDIFQFQTAVLIKTDLGFALVDFHFFRSRDDGNGLVKQVEAGIQRKTGSCQAAITHRSNFHSIAALDAHLPAGVFQ